MKVFFLPDGPVCEAREGETLHELALCFGLPIAADCGGLGKCGKCRVRIMPPAPEPTAFEREAISAGDLALGWRLACHTHAAEGMKVRLAGETNAEKGLLRFPGDFAPIPGEGLGAAIDIGTTTVALMLYELKSGERLATVSRANPEGVHGADVISRIAFCGEDEGNLALLQGTLVSALDDMLRLACARCGASPREVTNILAVGNTAMSHIFLGVDPASLARAPFSPAFLSHEPVAAGSLGFTSAPEATASVLPNIAGHVGSDITAAINSSRLTELPGASMLIDVGTNGEIALYSGGRLLVCSTAAGPAFEGSAISCGMRAAPGAVCAAQISSDGIRLSTVGGGSPTGLCGSGLIDLTCALLRTGLILPSGRFARRSGSNIYEKHMDGSGFIISPQARLTQKDVREVQLAKGAIAAGARILMDEAGIEPGGLSHLMLAGAFGSNIDPASALGIGLLPEIDAKRIISIGNAAGAGASMALLSGRERARAEAAAGMAEHIELSTHPAFEKLFLANMAFSKEVK